MDNTLSVSAVVTCYNKEKNIQDSIFSLLNQTYPIREIFVVDDGSTDNSRNKIMEVVSSNPCVFPIFKQNGGTSSARNAGIKLCTGDLICMLDGDDEYYKEKVEKSVEIFLKYPDMGLVYTDYDIKNEITGKIVREFKKPPDYNILLKECVVSTNPIINRVCFEEVGMFDETLKYAEDYDMWLRIAERFRIFHIPEPLFQYRVNDTCKSVEFSDMFPRETVDLQRKAINRRLKDANSAAKRVDHIFQNQYIRRNDQRVLCMIGDNCYNDLKEIIYSCKNCFDKIVYVEGSDNHSKDIENLLRDIPNIIHIKTYWSGDHSVQRNKALEYVDNGSVVFQLDMKERFAKCVLDDLDGFMGQIEKSKAGCVYTNSKLIIYKYYDDMFFSGNPHETLINRRPQHISIDDNSHPIIVNLRKWPHHIIHDAQYYFYKKNNNHLSGICYSYLPPSEIRMHENWRIEFYNIARNYNINTFEDFAKVCKDDCIPAELWPFVKRERLLYAYYRYVRLNERGVIYK